MANHEDNKISSGAGGNTSGTGGPGLSGMREGAGAGAAGTQADERREAAEDRRDPGAQHRPAVGGGSPDDTGGHARSGNADDLAHAPQVAEASEGGINAAAPGPRGGTLSSEGTGSTEPRGEAGGGSPSGGDVGGMGGPGPAPANPERRPPGGDSPLEGRDE